MNSHKIIVVALLCMAVCALPDVRAFAKNNECPIIQQIDGGCSKSGACLDLRDALSDEELSQELLQDRSRIHAMLQQRELRQEMLQHPRFVWQMMQVREMRQELMQNEQMMQEMLQNSCINHEINLSMEMMKEIEKNEIYKQRDHEQQAVILEEILLK